MMYYLCANDPESEYPEERKITDESESIDQLKQKAAQEIGDVWIWWIEDEEGNAVYDPNDLAFLQTSPLHAAGQKVVERPIVWVEYKGRWVAVVEVEEAKENADNQSDQIR